MPQTLPEATRRSGGQRQGLQPHANLLTRMAWVRFFLSFDFLRASQSMYGFVFCTPGALSAYRREAIIPILDDWRQQTFLGVRCTIGEDRAFTNLVLR